MYIIGRLIKQLNIIKGNLYYPIRLPDEIFNLDNVMGLLEKKIEEFFPKQSTLDQGKTVNRMDTGENRTGENRTGENSFG